jgi:SOS regulatory protein LexA
MLTDRQRSVLDFIQREQREKGITPSTREIQNHFGFASQTSVMQYIAALERKGFLDRHARKARALITPAMKVRITDVPIYGQIPAGMSALTEQTVEGHVSLDARSANAHKNRGTFALRVRGDSMIGAHIVDGDIVILEDAKDVHIETLCRRTRPAISQGGKPALPGFGSGSRTEDSRGDGIAGSEARAQETTLIKKSRNGRSQAVSRILLYCYIALRYKGAKHEDDR